MPDDVVGSAWSLDVGARTELRMSLARRALRDRDLLGATLELEELLDDEPDRVDALALLAATCLAQHDVLTARHALRSLHERTGGTAASWLQLAQAEMECWDFVSAEAAAHEALARNDQLSEAWHLRGLLAERRDAFGEADELLMRAWELNPLAHPLPLRLSSSEWEDLVDAVLDTLSENGDDFWDDVPLQLEAFPERPPPSSLLGVSPRELILGDSEPKDADLPRPTTLRVFWGNLAHCGSVEETLRDLREALEREAVDWELSEEGEE